MNPVTPKDQKIFYTVKKRKFYGKITGNHLPVHFPLFLRSSVNICRRHHAEQGRIEASVSIIRLLNTITVCSSPFSYHNPTIWQFPQNLCSAGRRPKIKEKELAVRCQVFYYNIYGFFPTETYFFSESIFSQVI